MSLAIASLVVGAGVTGAARAKAASTAPPVPSYLQISGTDTVTPVLSGVVQDSADAPLSGEFFLLTASGTPIGGAPTATGQVSSGERITYQVPDGTLSDGTSYQWYMEACYQGTCSSATAATTFAINTSSPSLPGTASATVSGSGITDFDAITDSGGCSGSDCAIATDSSLKVGGAGAYHWASALKFNLSAIPADTIVTGATLDLTQASCIGICSGGQSPLSRPVGSLSPLACPPGGCAKLWTGTLNIYPADSNVASVSTGTQLAVAADPGVMTSGAGNAGSYDVTSLVQTWADGGMPNDGMILEAAGNATATSGADYYSTNASAPAADLPELIVTYAPIAAPGAPAGLIVTPGDGGAELRWDVPADQGDMQGVTGYTAQALTSSGTVAASASPDGTSAVLTGLTNGQQYTIRVAATNADGMGLAATATASPAAVAGSAVDIAAVQQFLNARTGLREGEYATVSTATSGDSQASAITTQLSAEQPMDASFYSAAQTAAGAETGGSNTLSNTLVVAMADETVQVYATDDLAYTTLTGSGRPARTARPASR